MNLIILGPQGSGKGTQAKMLAEKFNLVHIEMCSALRKQAAEDTPLGKKLDEIVNRKRELVSDDIVADVIREEAKRIPADKGIILDGAPRKMSQIDEAEDTFKENGRKLEKVIFVKISESESVNRISKRCACSKCGKGFILGKDPVNLKGICPECGGKIIRRKDDTPDGVKKRLEIFNRETIPVLDYYRNKGLLMEINGEKNINNVFEDIVNKLKRKK